MKLKVIFLFLLLSLSLVSASINVINYTLGDISKYPYEIIGKVNISIKDQDLLTKITSSDGNVTTLKDFLERNGVKNLDCIPSDCSSGYERGEEIGGFVSIDSSTDKKLGFILIGKDASVGSVDFDLTSNFVESTSRPLSILFFEDKKWEFEGFSNKEFSAKDWGCYDNTNANTVGSKIGIYSFCEEVYIPRTNKIQTGAKVYKKDASAETKLLKMSLYDGDSNKIDGCSYNPKDFSEEGFCNMTVTGGKVFEEGKYKICVNADETTEYRIYNESTGKICGSVLSGSSTKDYSVFARTAKYEDNSLLSEKFVLEDLKLDVLSNNYVENKYDKDCSNECILPIKFSGISQKILVNNVAIEYFADGDLKEENKIYEIKEVPAKVSFNGELDLGKLDFFVLSSGEYELKIGDELIFNESFDIVSLPKIKYLLPLSSPAGIPIRFDLGVDFNGTKPLTYKWNFGDGTEEKETSVPYLEHTYEKVRNYIVKVKVITSDDLSVEQIFDINTTTPEIAIKNTLLAKKNLVALVQKIIDAVPLWYKQDLSNLAILESSKAKLNSIEKSQQVAVLERDLIIIVKQLYDLNVPSNIEVTEFKRPYLSNKPEDVNIKPLLKITNDVTASSNDEYKNSIIGWQNKNIQGSELKKIYEVKMSNGESAGSLSTYEFIIKSVSNEDSYFIVNQPLSKLKFSKSVGAKEALGYSVIPISALSEKEIKFYYSDSSPISYFVSPSLSSIPVESLIDRTCNYNLICEKSLGENEDNCRIDCAPIKKVVMYLLLIILSAIGVYTLLGIWYDKNYEKYLFKDKRELYNILMFVANAKTRGMTDSKISFNLKRQGWSVERINFIIKKSNGKRTGLPEIIPLSKISAAIRNSKAKKQFNQNNVMTNSGQQNSRNINKSGFARRV